MKTQVLYFEGCPNHAPAVELIREILAELGSDGEIDEVRVEGTEQVNKLRFLGSPSIRVDGVDVEPEARERTDYAYCCRTYAGGVGLPSREMIVRAIVETSTAAPTNRRSGLAAAAGSVLTAVGASACCWVPLLAIAFGTTAGGASAFLERWRPWLIGASVVLLGVGFYSVYFRSWRGSCCDTGVCAARSRRLHVFNQTMIWLAVVMVGGAILFPTWGSAILRTPRTDLVVQPTTSLREVSLGIDGMTCDLCEIHVVRELLGVPGVFEVTASYERGVAELSVDEAASPTADELAAAVSRAGYKLTGTNLGETP